MIDLVRDLMSVYTPCPFMYDILFKGFKECLYAPFQVMYDILCKGFNE